MRMAMSMVMGYQYGKMDKYKKDSLKIVRSMERVELYGMMVKYTQEMRKKVNGMVK